MSFLEVSDVLFECLHNLSPEAHKHNPHGPTPDTLQSVKTDNSKMQAIVGKAQVPWQEGIKAMVEAAGALK